MALKDFSFATERLIVRPYRATEVDADAYVELFEDASEGVTEIDSDDVRRDFWNSVRLRSDEQIEIVGFFKDNPQQAALDITVEIDPVRPHAWSLTFYTLSIFRGIGLMTEALGVTLPHLHDNGIKPIDAQVDLRNGASLRVMQKLEFERQSANAEWAYFRYRR